MVYHINQSPLYKLSSRRRLAELLRISLRRLEALARSDNYTRFDREQAAGKLRRIELPKPELMRLHRRILNLLSRIEVPDYLHSARRGRSYITNAASHTAPGAVAKLDLKAFFPSTSAPHIYAFFRNVFKQEPDVAWTLTSICTCDGHLPTGSPISTLLAFHVHSKMFEEVASLCQGMGVRMTCYVDDVTFSGDKATKRLLWQIAGLVRSYGPRPHKFETYPSASPKLVTGAIIVDGDLRLPNKRHMIIHRALKLVERGGVVDEDWTKSINSIRGRIAEARTLDPGAAAKLVFRLRRAIKRRNDLVAGDEPPAVPET